MSWLLFMDESGHDHRNMPYEVRGGVTLSVDRLWPFIQAVKQLEVECFGDALHRYKSELKGHKLLDKDRFRWARQDATLDDVARRKHALAFLNKGVEKRSPARVEFTAFGQASLRMARGVFELLVSHRAELFAVAIPRSVAKPTTFEAEEYLRKDHVFLLERFFYFLEEQQRFGLLVMDESEKGEDRVFVRRLERYFTATHTGRYRSARIVPSPFFVSSDMSYPVQVADICIYCINWGFRLPQHGMDAPTRPEIENEFKEWLFRLQFEGEGYRDGQVFPAYGIAYVPNPYGAGRA